jgi:hypothetical protein
LLFASANSRGVYRQLSQPSQRRGEFFNILNHPNFGVFSMNRDLSVPSSVGTAVFTPDLGLASNPVLGTGGSRHIQLGDKFIW